MKSFAVVVAFTCAFAIAQVAAKSDSSVQGKCDMNALVKAFQGAAKVTIVYWEEIRGGVPTYGPEYKQCLANSGSDYKKLVSCIESVTNAWMTAYTPATKQFISNVSGYVATITQEMANCHLM